MMRQIRWREMAVVGGIITLSVLLVVVAVRQSGLTRANAMPVPESVPDGDWEVAWINTPTAADTWDEFVTGVKRIEMAVPGVVVDTSEAFPEQTTSVPEVVVSRPPHAGKLRFRWYKTGTGAATSDWVAALAQRDPAPLAIIGGWSSDRAIELAELLNRQQDWVGDRPLLFLTAATVDRVQNSGGTSALPWQETQLTELYPKRMFRFCFTNKQMAKAVTDYLTQDATLWSESGTANQFDNRAASAVAGWPAALGVAANPPPRPAVFTMQWQDDPFSEDLADYFTEALNDHFNRAAIGNPDHAPHAPMLLQRNRIPFSTGSFTRPNPGEAEAVAEIARQLPPNGERAIVIIPTVTAPMRRAMLSLSERIPRSGHRLVAITGDGLSVNTLYRDVDYVWPVRSIPIPLVMFCHENPFGWDEPNGPAPPPGYALEPASKRSTQDILLYRDIGLTLIQALLPAAESGVPGVPRADALADHLRGLQPKLFHDDGNRVGGSGEHIVVMRPMIRDGKNDRLTRPDAVIDVYRHVPETGWTKVHSVEVRSDPTAERRSPS